MIAISTAEQNAFQGSAPKELILEFPIGRELSNEDICMESSTLEQAVCDEANLTFGMVYSSSFSVRIFDDGLSYRGLKVLPHISVAEGNETYTRDLGEFVVKSDKLTSDKIYRDLKCYDALVDVLPFDYAQWHNSQSDSFTLKQYRDAFFSYIGLVQETISLPNDSVTLTKFTMEKVSGAEILSVILQLNGCFGYIGYDGKFKYVKPKITADYSIDDYSYSQGSFDYEDEPMSEISGVKILGYEDDYDEESYSVSDVSSGDDTNSVYTVSDNYLIHSADVATRQIVCDNLYALLDGFTYYPSSIQLPPYIGMELGDVFEIVTERKTVTFPVLKRTLSGISALRDVLEAKGSSEITTNTNSISGGVNNASMAINQIRLSVSELLASKATISDLNAANAKINVLETNYVTVNSVLTAHTANIENLTANKASISDLNAAVARIVTLEADYAVIGQLEADYANISTLLSGNAGIGELQNIHLTSANAVIDEAVIKGLVSNYISVNDLLAGSINTNKFTVGSEDGSLLISGATQYFKDADGNTRIQIGLDANDNFTFVLYDASGQGILLDETGIKESGIADGLIRDAKIANNANINAGKLDIASLFSAINEDGTHSLKSSRIYLDEEDQFLSVAFAKTTDTLNSLVDNGTVVFQVLTDYSDDDEVNLEAKIYQHKKDIQDRIPASWVSWYSKSESEFTQIGTGHSITVNRSDFDIEGTIVARLSLPDSMALLTPDNKHIILPDGNRLAVYSHVVNTQT